MWEGGLHAFLKRSSCACQLIANNKGINKSPVVCFLDLPTIFIDEGYGVGGQRLSPSSVGCERNDVSCEVIRRAGCEVLNEIIVEIVSIHASLRSQYRDAHGHKL